VSDFDSTLARYSRQMLFEPFGIQGQKRLVHSHVALIGCGALGTVLANTLVRAGVGYTRIVDRDFIELDNLQRQVLFDEHDIAQNLPKAEAAARKLRKINSSVEVEAVIADVHAGNIESLCHDVDLILDGTDNFETRFLINDVAVKLNLPWVYGACIAAEGLVMPILPRQTPCLRCVWEDAPPPGMTPTCDTAGVLGTVVNVVASLQALEAMKILAGKLDDVVRKLVTIDVWTGRMRAMDMQASREQGNCICCKQGRYEFLAGERASAAVSLCGREAVQISPASGAKGKIDFRALSARLKNARPSHNEYMLKFTVDSLSFTVFPDGRAIIKGTHDPVAARAAYAKYVGA
jgi:molybdopterin/thiamine biosynthesis adenylyltransferase